MASKTASARVMGAQDKKMQDAHNRLCDIIDSSLFTNLPSYADNAAAIAGGLKVGQLYRTADTLKVVH